MAQRQEDDVARLLEESGTYGASYRSFDNASVVRGDPSAMPAESHITPLISEIFGGVGAAQAPAAEPLAPAVAPPYDPPPVSRPAPLVVKTPVDRSHIRAVSPPAPAAMAPPMAPQARPPSAQRSSSLGDIRRVLEGDLEKPAGGGVNGALRGIFDRLAE